MQAAQGVGETGPTAESGAENGRGEKIFSAGLPDGDRRWLALFFDSTSRVYLEVNGRHPSVVAANLGISTAHVQTLLAYFVQHREEVLEGYRGALARIARGNRPEVEANLRRMNRFCTGG